MAVSNLTTFWVKRLPTRYGDYQTFFEKLRPSWRQKLMELILYTSLDNMKILLDWRNISDKFVATPPPPAPPAPSAPSAPEVTADKKKSK